jgi:hypothetical protein
MNKENYFVSAAHVYSKISKTDDTFGERLENIDNSII